MRGGADKSLAFAAVAFVAANLLHTADHVRQGLGGLSATILVGGSSLTILAIVVMVMVLRGYPRAPAFAAVVGLSGAAGGDPRPPPPPPGPPPGPPSGLSGVAPAL